MVFELAWNGSYIFSQPYHHLSSVLRKFGHHNIADDILYGSRAREREESSLFSPKWLGLWILQLTIGYGYGRWNFLALFWATAFVIAGYIVLQARVNRNKKDTEEDLGIWYSIDILLPIVRLRERHYERELDGWARWYFFAHRIIGYVLTLFVIAGLTGLTK